MRTAFVAPAACVVALSFVLTGCTNPPSPAPSTSPVATLAVASVPPSAPPASETPSSAPPASVQPDPSTEPNPTETPSPTPDVPATTASTYTSAFGLGDVSFTADGRVVMVEEDWTANRSQVTMLDADGVPMPGWPWSAGDTKDANATAAVDPAGGVWVMVRTMLAEDAYRWALYHVGDDGQTSPGFPVALPRTPNCLLQVAGDRGAFASCQVEDPSGNPIAASVRLVTRDGAVAAGWPRKVPGSAFIAGLRRDGALVMASTKGTTTSVTALGVDGEPLAGWPRAVASGDAALSVVVDPQDRLRITSWQMAPDQCGDTLRTVFTVRNPDGDVATGWPITVRGWASEPLVAADGSSVTLSQSGVAIRRTADGAVMAGWPVKDIALTYSCGDGTRPFADGSDAIVVAGGRQVVELGLDGKRAPGFPSRLPVAVADPCPDCTPGSGATIAPAIGGRAIWVAAYLKGDRPAVIGVARDGSQPDGWGAPIGEAGDMVRWLRIAPNGRVWAGLEVNNPADDGYPFGRLVPVADDPTP